LATILALWECGPNLGTGFMNCEVANTCSAGLGQILPAESAVEHGSRGIYGQQPSISKAHDPLQG